MSTEQVSDALDQIGNRCQRARSKIERWGLEKFELHNIVEANPDTWTAGVRNSNLVERVMNEMLGYGDDNGRGGMFAHMFLRSHVFALTSYLLWCLAACIVTTVHRFLYVASKQLVKVEAEAKDAQDRGKWVLSEMKRKRNIECECSKTITVKKGVN